jgi:hypothetical protein
MEVQRDFPPEEAHGGHQPEETEHMITVKVRDKEMVDPGGIDPESPHLHLGPFTTIDQKKPLIYLK